MSRLASRDALDLDTAASFVIFEGPGRDRAAADVVDVAEPLSSEVNCAVKSRVLVKAALFFRLLGAGWP